MQLDSDFSQNVEKYFHSIVDDSQNLQNGAQSIQQSSSQSVIILENFQSKKQTKTKKNCKYTNWCCSCCKTINKTSFQYCSLCGMTQNNSQVLNIYSNILYIYSNILYIYSKILYIYTNILYIYLNNLYIYLNILYIYLNNLYSKNKEMHIVI